MRYIMNQHHWDILNLPLTTGDDTDDWKLVETDRSSDRCNCGLDYKMPTNHHCPKWP